MIKRVFTPCIVYGIEYRMFFLSGISRLLLEKGHDIYAYKRDIQNPCFDEYTDNIKVMPFSPDNFTFQRTALENYFHVIRKCRMRLKGIGTFKNYNQKADARQWRDYLLGNEWVYKMARFLVKNSILKHYNDIALQETFKNLGSTDILLSGYSSSESIAFAINAKAVGARVWCFVNSWKDLYINDFLPFEPDALFVWSDKMKDEYLTLNTHIKNNQVVASGNPVFDRFYKSSLYHDRAYYDHKYTIKPERKIILYSMLDPQRYAYEAHIIMNIAEALQLRLGEHTPLIVVRKNPFDQTRDVDEFLKNTENVRVAEHFSCRDKENDFFTQGFEGEYEWKDLLSFSSMNIGAASTVALEAIMLSKPVITIGFDESGKYSSFMHEMAEAPFYKTLLERTDVTLSATLDECVADICMYLDNEKSSEKLPQILGTFSGRSADDAVEIMMEKS